MERQPHLLEPLPSVVDKKTRDKQRKRDQSQRRKAAAKYLEQQAFDRARQADASTKWHRDKNRDEELQIRRYELDTVSAYEEHPASAGYVLSKAKFVSLPKDAAAFTPVFFGYSLAKGALDDPFGPPRGLDDRLKHPPHPAFLGYAMSRHCSEVISPIFLNMDFAKRKVALEAAEDELLDLQRQSSPARTAAATQEDRLELQRLLDARFENPTECLICESSEIPGCPGCWVPSSDFFDRAYRFNNPVDLDAGDVPPQEDWVYYYEAPSPRAEAKARETEYLRGLLFDVWAIRLQREKFQSFITVVIKSIPAGSAVKLRIDPKETVKNLYDLYRANFEGFSRKIYLLLPTSQGLFLMDETLRGGSEVALRVDNGNITLEDFQLRFNARTGTPYVLISVALLHAATTPLMLAHYVKHNFTVDGPVNLQIRYYANQVPHDVQNDALQAAMARKADLIIDAATENRIMSQQYDQLELERNVKRAFQERMVSVVDLHRRNKTRPRTKKEIRAWAYYNFAVAEPRSDLRLQKLWQSYHKFEELKITKRGKLQDAAASDDMCELLSLHRSATIQTYDLLVDKAHRPHLPPVVAVGAKFGIFVAVRLGVTAKEDREYGAELELVVPEEEMDVEKPRRKHEHLSAEAIRAAQQRPFKDMEWRATAKADKLYNAADLLLAPFAHVRWDCFAKAYLVAVGDLDRMRRALDAYNNLAKALQNEAILKAHEIDEWGTDLAALQIQLPPTGALAQACRRLQAKSSLLPARAERHRKALKKAQDDALLRLTSLPEELPPMSAMERLKYEFKHKHGLLSPSMQRLTPDLGRVKAKVGAAVAKSVEVTKYVAQQAKDNVEILKL
ncbi:hypothetical protein ACHHYP_08336 [Achlya hypogyna]|uniref:Uncharacterized protein n=1 Tax=Achlya hypogyna TaxID=1202772 RepID=A0A1V9ZKM9_ACHHY|nr:hypothetical protein ACHHYP_08336 [Achlya hypogyna]